MKKFLSLIIATSLIFSVSNTAYAGTSSTGYDRCSVSPTSYGCGYTPAPRPPVVTPTPHPVPPSHGVSEPIGMLAMLTAVSLFFASRRRA